MQRFTLIVVLIATLTWTICSCGSNDIADNPNNKNDGSAGSAGSAGSTFTDTSDDAKADTEVDADADVEAAESEDVDADTEVDAVTDTGIDAGLDASEDAAPVCPSCDELLTWDTTGSNPITFGAMQTDSDWPDSYAQEMLNTCADWSIHDGHQGGIGDTLETSSCNDGLVLVWAHETFWSIKLSTGWNGTTDKGISIGSSLEDFIKAYPDYEDNSYIPDTGNFVLLNYAAGLARFDNNELTELSAYSLSP